MLHTIPLGIVSSTAAAYLLEQSLLFDGASHLSRTPSVAGNRKTATLSVWTKRSDVSATNNVIMSAYDGTANNRFEVFFHTSFSIRVQIVVGGVAYVWTGVEQFKDASAWGHVVVATDTTATSGNRLKVYFNGTQLTGSWGTEVPLNTDLMINSTNTHAIGVREYGSGLDNFFDGLMALPQLVDGAALAPTAFGETDDGFWNPIEFTGATTTDLISSSTGTAEDTGTTSFGYAGRVIANAFNDVTVATDANSANTANHTTPAALGKDWGTDTLVTRAVVYGQSGSAGIHGVGTFDLTLQGWNGSAWVDLSTLAGLSGSAGQIEVLNYSGGVSYSKHRVLIDEISNSEQTAVAELQFFTESTSEGFGTNGFQLDFADSSNFGKDTATTATPTASTSGAWAGDTGNTTFSGDDLDHGAATSIYAAEGLTGDFEVTGIQVDNATGFRFAVYDAAEQGTFNSTDADGGLKSMTNSAMIDGGNNNYYSGSTNDSGSPNADFSNGTTAIIKRVGSTILAIDAADGTIKHTFSAAWSGTTNIMFGNTNTNFDDISWTDESVGVIGNDYTANNFTASDQLEDTPTDSSGDGIGNFSTLNPNDDSGSVVLSEGNLTATIAPSAWNGIRGTIGAGSGKVYFEVTDDNGDVHNCSGMASAASILTNSPGTATQNSLIFNTGDYYEYDATYTSSTGTTTGQIRGHAFDLDAGKAWYAINNTWQNSGNPSTAANPIDSSLPTDGTLLFPVFRGHSSSALSFNFGQKPFAYTPPTGFSALATQNLLSDNELYTGTASQWRDGAPVKAIATYTSNATLASIAATSFSFSSQAIGTPSSDRKVVVVTHSATAYTHNDTVSSMTIGGISATLVVRATPASNGQLEMWEADVPSGTTATIVVNWSRSRNGCGIGAWAVTGANSSTYATATDITDPLSQTLTIPARGCAIGGAFGFSTPTFSWTGLTENYEQNPRIDHKGTGASASFNQLQTDLTITAGESVFNKGAMILASWAEA